MSSVVDLQGEYLYYGVKVDITSIVYICFIYLRFFVETETPAFLHYSSPSLIVQYI
jgi:hypothetical protein